MKEVKSKDKLSEEEIIKNTRSAHRDLFMEYMPYLIIIFFVVIIRIFIATPVKVNGSSMSPTLENGDFMILYKLTKRTKGINRFDIVVIKTDSGKLIKRVIGLPGDTIKYSIETNDDGEEVGVLYINGEVVEETFIDGKVTSATCKSDWTICTDEIIVPEGEYYVMGDNRGNSKDSRMIGTVDEDSILGTTELIFFPFNRMGKVD